MLIQGIAEDVYAGPEKTNSKGRKYFQVSVTVGGVRYGAFTNKGGPLCGKGDKVEFEAEKSEDGKYWNFDAKEFKILERGAVQVPASSGASGNVGGGDVKQDMICRQNALAHATALVLGLSPKKEAGPTQLVTAAHDAAQLVVALANTYFFPYSSQGIVSGGKPTPAAEKSVKDDDVY